MGPSVEDPPVDMVGTADMSSKIERLLVQLWRRGSLVTAVVIGVVEEVEEEDNNVTTLNPILSLKGNIDMTFSDIVSQSSIPNPLS